MEEVGLDRIKCRKVDKGRDEENELTKRGTTAKAVVCQAYDLGGLMKNEENKAKALLSRE